MTSSNTFDLEAKSSSDFKPDLSALLTMKTTSLPFPQICMFAYSFTEF